MICFSFSASLSFLLIIESHLNRCNGLHFLEHLLLFLNDNGTKKVHSVQTTKVQPQGVAYSFCLIICQFQPGVAYKCAAYKENVYRKTELCKDYRSVFVTLSNIYDEAFL